MKDLVIMGDSTSEVLDYIFGKNPSYHPLWASGWSIRGMRNLNSNPIKAINDYLLQLDIKNTILLLNFGFVDLEFNLPWKLHHFNYYDFPTFLQEMIQGYDTTMNYFKGLGLENIFPVFIHPLLNNPLPLRLTTYYHLPLSCKKSLQFQFTQSIANKFPQTINLIPSISDNDGLLLPQLRRENINDHHMDYVKAQDIVYEGLKVFLGDNILPRRNPKLQNLYYDSIQHAGIDDIKFAEKLRPNTCK